MSIRRFGKRVGRLEKTITASEFEWGSTRIAWESLSMREQMLFQKIQEITEKYGNDPKRIPDSVLVENSEIVTKALEIMVRRGFDLFKTTIDEVYLKDDDELNKWIFWVRFHAFFITSLNIVKMRRIEEEHYGKMNEKYGEEWPDDAPEPDYSGIGERDFNKALEALTASFLTHCAEREEEKDGTG